MRSVGQGPGSRCKMEKGSAFFCGWSPSAFLPLNQLIFAICIASATPSMAKTQNDVKKLRWGHGPAFPASGGAARCQRAASGLLMPDRPGSAAPPCRPPANKAGPAAHSGPANRYSTARSPAPRPGTGCPRCRAAAWQAGNSRAGAPSAPRPMRQAAPPAGTSPEWSWLP